MNMSSGQSTTVAAAPIFFSVWRVITILLYARCSWSLSPFDSNFLAASFVAHPRAQCCSMSSTWVQTLHFLLIFSMHKGRQNVSSRAHKREREREQMAALAMVLIIVDHDWFVFSLWFNYFFRTVILSSRDDWTHPFTVNDLPDFIEGNRWFFVGEIF